MTDYTSVRKTIDGIFKRLEAKHGVAHAHAMMSGILTATASQALETLHNLDPKAAASIMNVLTSTAAKYE